MIREFNFGPNGSEVGTEGGVYMPCCPKDAVEIVRNWAGEDITDLVEHSIPYIPEGKTERNADESDSNTKSNDK